MLPALRGAVSSERLKVLCVDTSPRVLEFVASAAAPELVEVGAPCPDHLVHTKRLPLWVPFDPAVDDAATLVERIRELAPAYRDDYRAYVERFGDADTVPADPDAADRADPERRARRRRDDGQGRSARRATSTTARSR